MAVRTTENAVLALIEVHESITDLTPFIATASSLVDTQCVNKGYSDARMELIERWLSAHFVAMRERQTASEGAGISTTYQGQTGMGLSATLYGQQAMVLDTAGGLAALDNANARPTRAVVGVHWVGKTLTGT